MPIPSIKITQSSNKLWYLTLGILTFFSFYYALGSYPLLNNNEGLYASIAKHMLLTKSFIIPYLNCVPYIEKPPLLYWLLTASFSIFGLTAFAARFIMATSATLLCWSMLYFTHKIQQTKTGIIASLIFVSSIGISIIARMVYFDMLLTLLISNTLFCLFYWYTTEKIFALRLGYVFLGLAILTKGLIALVIIGGSFSLFLILEKKYWEYLRRAFDWQGIILFLAIVLPWHIAATLKHQGFLWHYIINEHFLRFLNLREPHDYYHGPSYYYLIRILIYLFPWSCFIPLIFLRTKTSNQIEQKLLRFCWCWLLVPLAFLSTSSAKANYYMIVSMPALVSLLSIKLNSLFASNYKRLFNIVVTTILFMISLCLIIFQPLAAIVIDHNKLTTGIIVYGLIAGFVSLILIKRSQIAAVALAGLIIPIAIATITIMKYISEDISAAQVGIDLKTKNQNVPLYLYQDFENFSAISFYTNNCFKIIENQSNDLYYGSQQAQFQHQFLTKQNFLQEITNHPCYVVVPNKKLEQFYQNTNSTKFFTIQKYRDLTIISNQPQ